MKFTRRRIVPRFNPARALLSGPSRMLTRKANGAPGRFGLRRPPVRVYGQLGNLEVRLARSRGDVRRAQRLRYQVFYEELSAIPDVSALINRRDEDDYDAICDHLLVVDRGSLPANRRRLLRKPRVIGTYRMLRQEVAERYDGFYSSGEYDIQPLLATKGSRHRFVELGRSCVLKPYRSRRTLEILWQGIWTYLREHRGDVMIGCASFAGTDPERHAMALSYLHHNALAPEDWRVRAHDGQYIDMNMMPASDIDRRAVMRSLPPLIKGYLRVGAFIGDGAVIDRQFGTVDVFVIMPVADINTRYFAHFGSPTDLSSPVLN